MAMVTLSRNEIVDPPISCSPNDVSMSCTAEIAQQIAGMIATFSARGLSPTFSARRAGALRVSELAVTTNRTTKTIDYFKRLPGHRPAKANRAVLAELGALGGARADKVDDDTAMLPRADFIGAGHRFGGDHGIGDRSLSLPRRRSDQRVDPIVGQHPERNRGERV